MALGASGTYSSDEDLVALLDVDRAGPVVHREVGLSLAVGAEGSEETESLQTVPGQFLIRLGCGLLGQTVDFRQMLLAFRDVVVDNVGELWELAWKHGNEVPPSLTMRAWLWTIDTAVGRI